MNSNTKYLSDPEHRKRYNDYQRKYQNKKYHSDPGLGEPPFTLPWSKMMIELYTKTGSIYKSKSNDKNLWTEIIKSYEQRHIHGQSSGQ